MTEKYYRGAEVSGDLYVDEESDRYDLKTDRGYYLTSKRFVGSSTWLMGPNVITLCEYLKATATPRGQRWKKYCKIRKKEFYVNAGELVKSIADMEREIKVLSRKEIRTALRKLQNANFFEDISDNLVKRANGERHLKLSKYEGYQDPLNYGGLTRGQGRAKVGLTRGQRIYINELNETNELNESIADLNRSADRPPDLPPPKTKKPKAPAQVEIVRELTHRYPHKSLWEKISQIIGAATIKDVDPYYTKWVSYGYNPFNLEGWLFGCFAHKSMPEKTNGNHNTPPQTPKSRTYEEAKAQMHTAGKLKKTEEELFGKHQP